jgi:hypothetical protein
LLNLICQFDKINIFMKRISTVLITLLLLVATLWHPLQVHAEDTIFTTTRLTDWAATAVIIGNQFGFDVAGLIVPSFQNTKENAIIDYEPYKLYMDTYTKWSMPGQYLQDAKITFWEGPIKRYSLYGAILKASAEHGEDKTSDECYISVGPQVSEPIPNLPQLTASGELIGGIRGLLPKEANDNGIIDTTKPDQLGIGGMNGAEDCKKQSSGVEREPFPNPQQRLSSFAGGSSIQAQMLETIYETVEKIIHLASGAIEKVTQNVPLIENARQQVILTKKTKQWYQQILCHYGSTPCPGRETGEYSKDLDKYGGWPAGFIGANEQIPVNPYAELEDEIQVVGFPAGKMREPEAVANLMMTGLAEASCAVVPSSLADVAVMGSLVNFVKILPWCRTAAAAAPAQNDTAPIPPNEVISSSILQGPSQCTPEGSDGNGGGGPANKAIVANAAAQWGIPTCVLDGVAELEGAYVSGACTPNQCGAMGPFQITVGYTYGNGDSGQCSKDTACKKCGGNSCPNAVNDYLQGVSQQLGHQINPCNPAEAAYAAGSMLKGKAAYFDADLTGSDALVGTSEELQDAVIYAGNSYFGSNYVFQTGSNVEPGCSYGESILKKYCGVSTYVCGSRNHSVGGSATIPAP